MTHSAAGSPPDSTKSPSDSSSAPRERAAPSPAARPRILAPSAPPNTSGNNVTTLIVSITVFHGHPQPAPGLRRLPSDPCKAEQPLTVVGPPPRHGERPCDHAPVFVHHVQEGLRGEHGAWILDEGLHRHLSPLAVRLAQPPDYAGRLPSTPACLSSERTVSVGIAPFAIHASALSRSTWIRAGLARGL